MLRSWVYSKVMAPGQPLISIASFRSQCMLTRFPASRGLSRRGKMKRGRETSAGFGRVSCHACARVSFTTSAVFVTCDTILRTGLNLSASSSGCWIWARANILNVPIRVEDETTLRAAVVADPSQVSEESRRGEFKGKCFVLHESFDRRSTRIWSEIYWALWNCWFIAIWDFSFWGKSDWWTSDLWPAMDGVVSLLASRGLSRRGKN